MATDQHLNQTNDTPTEDHQIGDMRFDPSLLDAYAPGEIARRVSVVGVAKARMPTVTLFTLAVLAGAFIAFGAMFYSVAVTDTGMGLGPTRVLGGLAFSLGLVLVLIGGAELFTGNTLIVMGWAQGKVTPGQLSRNWSIAYAGNFVGATGMAVVAYGSGFLHLGGDGVAATAIAAATAKVNLSFLTAFIRGVLCNVLVCLAVWLCFAARTVSSKILAIVFPITAFVALGFEHSIANMYFITVGIMATLDPAMAIPVAAAGDGVANLNLAGFIGNLIPVTLGNIIGGGVFVALIYYVVYLRDGISAPRPASTWQP